MSRVPFTLIIPAHQEASVIAATLRPLGGGAFRVIVVCNACTDRTAAVARATLPSAEVIETPVGGKANAINIGLAAAPDGAVIVLDADVVIDRAALDAMAGVLAEPGVAAASPRAQFDVTGASRIVRDYYRIVAAHRYQQDGVGGAGVYGLSVAGRQRLGKFPQVLSDDDHVRHFFPLGEQRRVSVDAAGRPVVAVVRPPTSVRELIGVEARWRAGDRASGAADREGVARRGGDVIDAWHRSGTGVGALAGYSAVKLSGRAMLVLNRLRGRAHLWHRDETSRAAPAAEDGSIATPRRDA